MRWQMYVPMEQLHRVLNIDLHRQEGEEGAIQVEGYERRGHTIATPAVERATKRFFWL